MLGRRRKNDLENRILDDRKNKKTPDSRNFVQKTKDLYQSQTENWLLLQDGIQNLSETKTKVFSEANAQVILQYNPQRIRSTAANLNPDSVAHRACFLCSENLPEGQKAMVVEKQFLLLCNPYPIFREHFTVVNVEHLRQQISGYLENLLNIARSVSPEFSIFYNGPECGASAPDHLHFQICPRNSTPLEKEYGLNTKAITTIFDSSQISVSATKSLGRNYFTIVSSQKNKLIEIFDFLYDLLSEMYSAVEEPMLNIFAWYTSGNWIIKIFPREKHRPDQYYREGNEQWLISPAAVDLAGLIITPSENNFNMLKLEDIKNIFSQVTISNEYFEYLIVKLKRYLEN